MCGTSCGAVSDRDLKERVAPADPAEVLDRLASVPISTWSYQVDPTVRHLGPMAQDFHAAFGLGASDRRIDFVDANGVTMAAIQALRREVGALREDTAALRRQNAGLQREVDALRGGTDQCVAP